MEEQEIKTPDRSRAKAAVGFEPTIKALQAHALPLGYAAQGKVELTRSLFACQRFIHGFRVEIA